MTVNLTNSEALPKVDFHRQVAIVTGSKLVFMAGQVAWDADGALIGKDDLAAQVEQCYVNVAAAVSAAGGTFDDVAKLTTYVADWTVDKMPPSFKKAAPAPSQDSASRRSRQALS